MSLANEAHPRQWAPAQGAEGLRNRCVTTTGASPLQVWYPYHTKYGVLYHIPYLYHTYYLVWLHSNIHTTMLKSMVVWVLECSIGILPY
jgi:hypothetical protein